MKIKLSVAFVLSVFTAVPAFAGTPAFTGLNQSDFDDINREISSNFSHISVMGAADLGSIWGVEVGVAGGINPSPSMDKLVQQATGGSNNLPNLYHAGAVLGVTVPFGITGELVYMPKMSVQGVDNQLLSVGVKLTLNESLLSFLPLNVAVRAFQTYSQFSFYQNQNGVSGTVDNTNQVTGFQLLASPKLPVFEPYAGFGYVSSQDKINLTGSGTIFNTAVNQNQSGTSTLTSSELLLGVNVKLIALSLGAEYARSFASDRYTAKVGFAF